MRLRTIGMTNQTITCLTDNYERMEKAVRQLKELRDSSIRDSTKLRLNGKIEGVELAMGYLHEDIREHRRADQWTHGFEQANG